MKNTNNICQGKDCGQPAKLQCPTCIKLKITGSYFCNQECFKKNWATHKLIHQQATQVTFNPWPHYKFTGSLRPVYPLSPKRHVPDHIQRPDYAEDGLPHSEINSRGSTHIQVLSPQEIEIMRKVCRMAREVLDEGARAIRVGITTDEIDRIIHEATIARNAYPSTLNYYHFPKSCCTSVNECICHGIPDGRPLQDGDIINIDVSLYYDGFHADLNETYLVGNVDEAGRRLVQNARECLEKAIALVRPGTLYRELGAVIEKHARSAGFSVVRTYCGHGVHRLFHCAPNVPHYAKNKAVGVMRPGHVFTIEPMINEGKSI
jgi:methionyl aminopeptidase